MTANLMAQDSKTGNNSVDNPAVDVSRAIDVESSVVTEHEVTIHGQKIPYSATAGTQPVWAEDGHPVATLFYTFYQRTDVKDRDRRPLIISFNGGPGSASVWMHLAYTGPRMLKIDDEGFPVQPYGVRENPHSILDVADIVFVNPVNTGYSRIVDPEADTKQFFGVNQDVAYLAEWINTFVTRANRWNSPKYLIGESYGTTRVSGLSHALQDKHWFDAKYSMWHLDPGGKLRDRLSFKGYRSGHMMYLRAEDLKNANDDIREFIQAATPAEGQPARYPK